MAHTASGTAQQLHQIIRMNEDVKTILATAEAINLLALNASVTARRIGSLGRGFVQVASELTEFSRETRRTMNNL
ncbi:MAG TPA: methyl-accepting chemotaxis protein, partial [Leptospiraceae bacterium]|nr:methyl-accepting chemotaxis protein [Leptospiraceae bacterium]